MFTKNSVKYGPIKIELIGSYINGVLMLYVLISSEQLIFKKVSQKLLSMKKRLNIFRDENG